MTTGRTVDDLWEKLLSDEEVDPGLLVRMDRDIKDLKKNPMVLIGQHLKLVVSAGVALVGIIATAVNLQTIVSALAATPGPHK